MKDMLKRRHESNQYNLEIYIDPLSSPTHH